MTKFLIGKQIDCHLSINIIIVLRDSLKYRHESTDAMLATMEVMILFKITQDTTLTIDDNRSSPYAFYVVASSLVHFICLLLQILNLMLQGILFLYVTIVSSKVLRLH